MTWSGFHLFQFWSIKLRRSGEGSFKKGCLLSVVCYLYFICLEHVPEWLNLGVFSVYPLIASWNVLIMSSCFLALTLTSRLYSTRKTGEIPQSVFLSFAGGVGILAFFGFLIGLMCPGGPLVGVAFESLSLYSWLVVLNMPDTEVSLRFYSAYRSLFPIIFLGLIWLIISLPYLLRGGRFTFRTPEKKA